MIIIMFAFHLFQYITALILDGNLCWALVLEGGPTYLFYFQPPLFVMVKFKIEKDNFIVFSKHFNPPRGVSIFHDLTQKAEFHANFISSVEG